jgi:hypothetical protein
VVKRDGFEERHFLGLDTGYPVNLSGRRRLGLNARPRDGQPGSGIQWFDSSDLCDTARPELGCAPPSPAPEPQAAVPAAPAPLLRGTPVTVEDMLGSLRISPEGSLGTSPVF